MDPQDRILLASGVSRNKQGRFQDVKVLPGIPNGQFRAGLRSSKRTVQCHGECCRRRLLVSRPSCIELVRVQTADSIFTAISKRPHALELACMKIAATTPVVGLVCDGAGLSC